MSIQTAKKEKLITQEQIGAEDLLNLATDFFSAIVLVYEPETNAIQYNPNQLNIELGYDPRDCDPAYFDIIDIIHPDDVLPLRHILERIQQGEKGMSELSCRFRKKSGPYVSYGIRIRRRSQTSAAILLATRKENVINEFNEISELKRIKAETETILQFGSFEYDIIADKAKWSDGLYELFGYKNEKPAISFTSFMAHLDPDNKSDVKEHFANRMAEKEYNDEYNVVARDGSAKTVQVIGRRLYNAQNEPVKSIGIVRDITHKRAQEEELKRAILELQHSNKELEEFAYVASHDLQEPLRKISTFTGRLSEKYTPQIGDEGKMYVDRIIASAGNMRTLIDNLLEFSRISRIKQPFVELNLNFILRQVRNELELSIEETKTVIKAEELPAIQASLTQMKQLFCNILNNAIKFRKQDVAPEIIITSQALSDSEKKTYHLPPERNYFAIRVCDNGIGFESEYATRIFQIFQRLHGKSEYPGSGIGLAICKKIVEQHNGVVFAENVPEKGACFTIILPEKQG